VPGDGKHVGVEQGAVVVGDAGQVGGRLPGAVSFVGEHDRDQGGVVGDRGGQRRRVDVSVRVAGQVGDLHAM
jgi:hypothetical protein